MRQIWISRVCGPEVLEVREAQDPIPGPGELRIRVHAAGINFADTMARIGLYPDAPKLPFVPGYEVAGVVDDVGTGVDEKRVGEKVVALSKAMRTPSARSRSRRHACRRTLASRRPLPSPWSGLLRGICS
jgi:NADPH:quinone reductase-like Zn-dependent oxidoreductase